MAVSTCLIAIESNVELEYGSRTAIEWGCIVLGAYCFEGWYTEGVQGSFAELFLFASEGCLAEASDSLVEGERLWIGV